MPPRELYRQTSYECQILDRDDNVAGELRLTFKNKRPRAHFELAFTIDDQILKTFGKAASLNFNWDAVFDSLVDHSRPESNSRHEVHFTMKLKGKVITRAA